MKPLTEIKDGQKVLVEFIVKKVENELYPYNLIDIVNTGAVRLHLTEDLMSFSGNRSKQTIYDFNQVMSCLEKPNNQKAIDREEFEEMVTQLITDYNWDIICINEYIQKLYDLFKSYNPESVMPEVGNDYEFSNDGEKWVNFKFGGFYGGGCCLKFIRPVQQPSKEELKAIELLKSKGYKIEKE